MLTLLSFLPLELMIVAFLIATLGVMVGIVRRHVLGWILLLLALLPLAGAVAAAAADILPLWLLIAISVIIALSLTRRLLALTIGERAADHVVGHVVAVSIVGTARMVGRLVMFPFRRGL